MKIISGIDIVYLPKFKIAVKKGGKVFLQKIYHENELKNLQYEHLAGIFALKEATIKSLNLNPGSWLKIYVNSDSKSPPKVQINEKVELTSYSASISHDGKYVIAQFVGLCKI